MPAHTASPAEGPRRRGAALRHLASFVRATTGAVAATATGYGMLSVLAALVGDHDLIYLRHLLDLGILPTGILTGAIRCMTEITTKPGLINIDFADLRTIMRSGGVAMVGTGESSAENRAIRAVDKALTSPLLPVDITGAKGALINVTGANDMTLKEAEAVLRVVQSKINKEARIIWGASVDESLDQTLRVMLVVTGVQSPQILGPVTNIEQELENRFGIDFVQ